MNNLTESTNRNPAEIKAEIAHHKEEIANTLTAAKDSLKAEELIDAGVDYVVEKSEKAYSSSKNFITENPIPVALATAGIASLIAAGLQMRSKNRYASSYSNPTASHLQAQVSATAAGWQESVKHTAHDAQVKIVDKSTAFGRSIQSLAENRPILTACIGAAIGAAIGGSMPRTRFEDTKIGPVRDQSINQIQRSAERLMNDAKEAVSQSLNQQAREADLKSEQTQNQYKQRRQTNF